MPPTDGSPADDAQLAFAYNAIATLIRNENPYPLLRLESSAAESQFVRTDDATEKRKQLDDEASAALAPGTPEQRMDAVRELRQARRRRLAKEGPARDFTEHKQLKAADHNEIVEYAERSHWWYFDGEPHRVVKALRIPFVWKDGDTERSDTILIGYVGWETS